MILILENGNDIDIGKWNDIDKGNDTDKGKWK